MSRKNAFLYSNGLSVVFLSLFAATIFGQVFFGWKEYNGELLEMGMPSLSLSAYLSSGHFVSATFENFQSEFLQMAMYVLLTISLRQKGSAESKSLEGKEEVDRDPDPHRPGAPWPVRKGGWALALYRNSLSLAFVSLFVICWLVHLLGSHQEFNMQQQAEDLPPLTIAQYLLEPKFWFESFQNWQSEFISVAAIVVLSVFLRQQGSPESKPVDAPNSETGK
ncbi:hypothetical protein M3B46_06765 [Sphingobacterium daejeonense]|uniref:DUF6766 family protein n=1 Tax=Sphingobacterium daejeonense TaxID=371142 RepID=UPI0021A93CC9|nr:DUF6766 family protein [Sphingobacterium daejeonense]MCT1530687.1 hypothetical protein [Sphingobacterium daejeonense]